MSTIGERGQAKAGRRRAAVVAVLVTAGIVASAGISSSSAGQTRPLTKITIALIAADPTAQVMEAPIPGANFLCPAMVRPRCNPSSA